MDDEESDAMVDEPSLIPETIIKVEINDKLEVITHKPSRSPSISPEQSHKTISQSSMPSPSLPIKIPSPNESIKAIQSHQTSVIQPQPPSSPLDLNSISPNGSKYCTTCDIPFKYANSYIAHKKFYCKANQTIDVMRPNNGPSPNAGSSVVVSRTAETSVL